MNVYEEAHNLSRAIKESEEYKQYKSLRDRIDQTPELAAMVRDMEQKQMELQAKQMAGELTPEEMQQQAMQMSQILMRDPLTLEYMQAMARFSVMMNDVSQILADAMGLGNQA